MLRNIIVGQLVCICHFQMMALMSRMMLIFLSFRLACSVADSSQGRDISKPLWEAKHTVAPAASGFNYLTIPEDTTPELVLDTLSSLRA